MFYSVHVDKMNMGSVYDSYVFKVICTFYIQIKVKAQGLFLLKKVECN